MIEGVNYLQATNAADNYYQKVRARSGGVSKKTGSDRFHCAVCDKSYLRKRHLQRHMRDECIGIPPRFSCDLCPSRFRRKYHMVRHLTSKHGVPPAIAQQASGNSHRNQSSSLSPSTHKDENVVIYSMSGENLSFNQQQQQQHNHNLGNCDNSLPENLTMRKENYESKPPPYLILHHQHNFNGGGGADSASPSHITSGDSGSDCNGGDTAGTSPIPGSHVIHMPTYGLTGAITAISAAAAHVEEKDAKILLEAAAAAAQAAAAAANKNSPHSPVEGNENIAKNQLPGTLTTYRTATNPLIITTSPGNNSNELQFIKAEPVTPTKSATASAATSSANMNMLDEEWKMKLSLQLISNSLLKERLMNTMPFAYQNK